MATYEAESFLWISIVIVCYSLTHEPSTRSDSDADSESMNKRGFDKENEHLEMVGSKRKNGKSQHFSFYALLLCFPFMFSFYVFLLCFPFMFSFYVFLLCFPFMFSFYVLHFYLTFPPPALPLFTPYFYFARSPSFPSLFTFHAPRSYPRTHILHTVQRTYHGPTILSQCTLSISTSHSFRSF